MRRETPVSERLTAIFNESMTLCHENPKLVAAVEVSIENQEILWQEELATPVGKVFKGFVQLRISRNRSFAAARRYAKKGKRVCVLNFASSVTPGGGVTYGSRAQEEDLCRISTLYPAISHKETAGEFYADHWARIREKAMGFENRDDCIYTPGVVVFRTDDEERTLLPEDEWYTVDVITCAAPDLRFFNPTREELLELFRKRFKKILYAAACHKAEVVILGAFGCGVFANPPEVVAEAFDAAYGLYAGNFETIEFAIYSKSEDSPNYRAFAKVLDFETE